MGNYVSCTLSGPAAKASSRGTKVILPSGEVRRLHEPTKAAELMMDVPNSFLVNTRSLQIGKRFIPLNADEDLELGHVYALFPMKRVNSTATAADMGVLFIAANSATRKVSIGCVRISPECGVEPQPVRSVERCGPGTSSTSAMKLNLEDIEEFSTGEFQHRLSMCRSKKPLLETIIEEPVCLR